MRQQLPHIRLVPATAAHPLLWVKQYRRTPCPFQTRSRPWSDNRHLCDATNYPENPTCSALVPVTPERWGLSYLSGLSYVAFYNIVRAIRPVMPHVASRTRGVAESRPKPARRGRPVIKRSERCQFRHHRMATCCPNKHDAPYHQSLVGTPVGTLLLLRKNNIIFNMLLTTKATSPGTNRPRQLTVGLHRGRPQPDRQRAHKDRGPIKSLSGASTSRTNVPQGSATLVPAPLLKAPSAHRTVHNLSQAGKVNQLTQPMRLGHRANIERRCVVACLSGAEATCLLIRETNRHGPGWCPQGVNPPRSARRNGASMHDFPDRARSSRRQRRPIAPSGQSVSPTRASGSRPFGPCCR